MSIRQQFKKEYCDVVFENHCRGNQVDCDKCYIKYLEQQIEAKDNVIEAVGKYFNDNKYGFGLKSLRKVWNEYEASHD